MMGTVVGRMKVILEAQSARLDQIIWANLEDIGYGK